MIEGQGKSASSTVISGVNTSTSKWNTRIFEIVGTGTAAMTVVFKDLEITGGNAKDGGVLEGNAALGGGILIDGGQVTLSNASVAGNTAAGASGAQGRRGPATRPAALAAPEAMLREAASTSRPVN